MYDLPLNSLRAFAAIYQTGGVRPAGRLLGVAHSAVARHMKELEAMLGAPLIERERDGRTLVFTPAGEALGKATSTQMDGLSSAWAQAKERQSPNTVTISAAPSVAALWLLPRLPHLAEALPKIEVSVLAEQRVRNPADEGSDLSIRMGQPRTGEIAEPLMDDGLSPVATPALLMRARAARGGPTGDGHIHNLLRDLPLLHDRDPNADWKKWIEAYGPSDLDTMKGSRFTSSDLLLRAARYGQGIALARLRLAKDELDAGTLVRLCDAKVALPDAYWLIAHEDRQARSSVQAVRQWLLLDGQRSEDN